MSDRNTRFTGSIPENYDRYLGPVLFDGYARDMARRVPAAPGTRLLEVACGTGIVTGHLRARLSGAGRFVATDLNPPMLDYARRKLGSERGIEWAPADVCLLPFPDASFDVLVCQFGLMFVPDKPAALKEARRVIAPGGQFLLSVWDSLERNRFAKVAHETIAGFFPIDPPTFYQVPFSLHRTQELKDMVTAAGFTAVRVEPVSLHGESAEARVLAREFGDRPIRIPLHAFVLTASAGNAPGRES